MEKNKKTRKCLSVLERLKLVDEIKQGKQVKEKIVLNKAKHKEIDEAVFGWFCSLRTFYGTRKPLPVSRELILAKAMYEAKKRGVARFVVSNGWISHWRWRHRVSRCTRLGEAGEVDINMADEEVEILLSTYNPNVFNMDELSLFYRAIPQYSYLLESEGEKRQHGQDQGIIAALKVWYKSSLLARLVETDEDISRLQSLAQQLPAGSAGLNLSQLTCEGLRLCLRTIKLSTTGNKATLVQRLLEHEDSHDPEHQQTDDSSSGSSDDRELGDRALTDGPSGRGYSRGLRGCRHSQGPSGLGRLVGSGSPLHSKECGDHSSSVLSSDHGRSGGPRDSECPLKDPVVVDAPGGVTIRLALPLQMRSSSSHAGNADPADAGLRPSSTPACIRKRRNTRRTVDAGQPRVPAFQHQQGIRPQDADDGYRHRRGVKRRRAHHMDSSSRSGGSSSSSSSDSSSSLRNRRRHHHRRRRSSSLETFSDVHLLFSYPSKVPSKANPASGTRKIPPHTLGSGEGRYSSVVRNPAPLSGPQQPSANHLQSSATHGATKSTKGRVTHTQSGQEISRKFNYASCNRAKCSFAHKCWFMGCLGDHPGKSCPRAPAAPGSELSKEIAAGRVLGPFTEKPFVNLQTSGLGTAPKKNGKWCVILHLSAPYSVSVNDGISKEEFSLHYSTIDDTVRLLLMHGVGCLMAKVDLNLLRPYIGFCPPNSVEAIHYSGNRGT
eukprot:Em0001g2244a